MIRRPKKHDETSLNNTRHSFILPNPSRLPLGDGYWLNVDHTHFRNIFSLSSTKRCRGSISMELRSYGCFAVLFLYSLN